MASDGKMLCLTIYSYKKEGLSDEDYRSYMLKTHAPLASTLMEKYGIVDFTMVTQPLHLLIFLFFLPQSPSPPIFTHNNNFRHT